MHIEEMVHQQLHIAVTLAQRRQGNRDNIEAVIEILAEFAFTDKLFQILVGRGHNPDIDGMVRLEPIGCTSRDSIARNNFA